MISETGVRSRILKQFREDLETLAKAPSRILDCTATPIDNLVEFLHNPSDSVAILTGLNKWSPEQWETLDLNRSRLEREGPLIFWLAESAVDKMFENAPNIRSYLAASIFNLDLDESEMTDEERVQRLTELHERFQMSDDEVVQLAQNNTLPPGPSFAEWLVLLKRGDLL